MILFFQRFQRLTVDLCQRHDAEDPVHRDIRIAGLFIPEQNVQRDILTAILRKQVMRRIIPAAVDPACADIVLLFIENDIPHLVTDDNAEILQGLTAVFDPVSNGLTLLDEHMLGVRDFQMTRIHVNGQAAFRRQIVS